jgi:hypothetical protein
MNPHHLRRAVLVCTTLLAASAGGGTAHAQRMIGDVAYSVSIPLDQTGTYAEGPGWIGVVMDWRSEVSTRLTLGLSAGWNRIRQDAVAGSSSATDGERTLDFVPLLVSVHTYSTTRRGAISIYGGLGVGAYWVHQGIKGPQGDLEESTWHFGVAPEIGVFAPLGSLGVFGNVKYHYILPTGTSLIGTENRHSYIAVGLGLAWSTF